MIYVTLILQLYQGPLTKSRLSSVVHRQKIVMSSRFMCTKIISRCSWGGMVTLYFSKLTWSLGAHDSLNAAQLCEHFFSPCGTVFCSTALKYFQTHQGHGSSFRPFELVVFKSIAATRAVGPGSAGACSASWSLPVQHRRMTNRLGKCFHVKSQYPLYTNPLSWSGNIVKLNSFWVCFNPDCFNTAHGIFCSLLGLSQASWRGSFNHIALISFTLTF